MVNEKRLIDANELKSKIQQYHNSLKPRYISKLVDAEIADIQAIIDEAPTVDAVEVVRCKDCKHRYTPNNPKCKPFCKNHFSMKAEDNDFCSYGERREGE